ncbi:MAG: hypothetical protein UZ18_ATM001001494 [Armatimonadetes bacterium OLB18]|nr:MAG: hypothetical protein UZ18_ATM001001494 [Armatimonadetes bacterium OLB18]
MFELEEFMKKLALAALVGVSAASYAAININFDLNYQTVLKPSSGSVFVTFTGTVDILLPSFFASGAVVEWPGNGSAFLSTTFAPSFLTYVTAATPGADYAGDLIIVEVASTDADGFYWLNGSTSGMSPLSELIVDASDGTSIASDNEFFGVTVVPEPASMAALGLGALALIRRRKN